MGRSGVGSTREVNDKHSEIPTSYDFLCQDRVCQGSGSLSGYMITPLSRQIRAHRAAPGYWIAVLALLVQEMYQRGRTTTIMPGIQRYCCNIAEFMLVGGMYLISMEPTKDTP